MQSTSESLWRVGQLESEYVAKAIESGLRGQYLSMFEERFAAEVGAGYAIAVNSGTSALHACLAALEIGPGDEVIVPPLTFSATAFAPIYVGATPVFADVDKNTFLIDPTAIKRKVTRRTKAIITVSLYGVTPELTEIRKIADANNAYLVEDNAQCIKAVYAEQPVGSFGDMTIYSLQRSKHMTAGDGGVITTNRSDLASRVRQVCDLGYPIFEGNREDYKEIIKRPDFQRHELIGYNFRMAEVCAAVGLAQLERLQYLVDIRRQIGEVLFEAVSDCTWLRQQAIPGDGDHAFWVAALVLDASSKFSWSEFKRSFLKNGGDSFYGAWALSYSEPAMQNWRKKIFDDAEFAPGHCPVAEWLQPRLIQLKTNYSNISEAKYQGNILRRTISDLESAVV